MPKSVTRDVIILIYFSIASVRAKEDKTLNLGFVFSLSKTLYQKCLKYI